jgi:ribosomal protein S18 acetylase RimI-like enzyme
MKFDKDEFGGLEGYGHIPIDYFIDRQGREHIFRFAGPRDLEKVLVMYRKYRPKRSIMGVPPEDPQRLEAWVRHFFQDGVTNLVVMDPDEAIVGHAAILPITDDVAEYFMAVLPVDQSAGIGRMLAVNVVEAAKYLSLKRLWIYVEKNNLRVVHLHQELGFVVTEGRWGWDYELTYDVRPSAP